MIELLGHMSNTKCHTDSITLMLILTLKPDSYPNPNHNPNPAYPSKPTERYQTVLTLTNSVGLQYAPSNRHTCHIV